MLFRSKDKGDAAADMTYEDMLAAGVGVEAPDDYTLVFTCKNPCPYFVEHSGHQRWGQNFDSALQLQPARNLHLFVTQGKNLCEECCQVGIPSVLSSLLSVE